MITRSDLLSINDKYREWLVNDDSLPPERDLSVQLHVPLKQIKQEKTLDSSQTLDPNQTKQEKTLYSSQTKQEKTLDSSPDIDLWTEASKMTNDKQEQKGNLLNMPSTYLWLLQSVGCAYSTF